MPQGGAGTRQYVVALARAAMKHGLDALAGQTATPLDANNTSSALRWLERAHRLVPLDPNATLALASACLAYDPARAASLFQSIADRHDSRQAWLGLAAARLRLTGPEDAAAPLAVALSRYAYTTDAAALAEAIGRRPGAPGWCALRSDGSLEIHGASPATAREVSPATAREMSPVTARQMSPVTVRQMPPATAREMTPVTAREIRGVRVVLDGKPLRGTILPAGWESSRTVDVRIRDIPLLGSPIQIGAIRRLAGCVEVCDGGIRGWAWHPGDPETAPALTLLDPSGRLLRSFAARDESITIAHTGPLARPRSFLLTRADLPDAPGPVHIRGPDGKDLSGSPLDPFADEAAHVAAALKLGQLYSADPAVPTRRSPSDAPASHRANAVATVGSPALHADGPVAAEPVGADGRKRAATIVIPVHDGGAVVLACLDSVMASVPAGARILVVDDGSSDSALIATLDDLVRGRKIALLRHPRVQGFPSAANAGIRAAAGRDVVLLNSDTLVPRRWLERLREAAYASRDIGTVTPLSNDASILSYPGPAGTNERPDQAATDRLDRAAERANAGTVVDIPVGLGFCLYLRRDCLNATGCLRADLFAQGYGEENDLCLRARRLGWRNVVLTGLFVGHLGGTSFGASAAHLRARNGRIVEQLHPGHQALIDDYRARDPLAESRRRIDLHRWREQGRKWRRSTILIAHNDGGGVEQRLLHAIKAHEQAGSHPVVLRPGETACGEPAISVRNGASDDLPNLIYAMPRELPALLRLLRAAKPEMIEAHHLADYPPAVYDLVARLGVPYDVHVHDYAWFCPRVSLVGANNRYCGEPDLPACEACIADNGHFLQEDITVAALRRRSATFLSAARRVVVPSDDTGIRMRRHFDGLATITIPHEDDAALPPASALRTPASRSAVRPSPAPRAAALLSNAAGTAGRGRASVCVVGGIGVHKGYDVLLACARDAVRRDLDLEFVVVGHTIDDARMLATGRVFVTGRFEPDEAVGLIAWQNARLGFVTSICPETWCLSLGDIWRAGLQAAAFDIGAPAERIRRTGRGILLPLGLSASAINNALVAAMWTAVH
jgi:GT2 family glycosyltransferase